MTPATPDRRINHLRRALIGLVAAHREAMTETAAAHQDASDIARAALAVAARPAAPAPTKSANASAHGYIERMKALIAEFSVRTMGSDDVMVLLGVSSSGARGYIKTLRTAGVIELARHAGGASTFPGTALFRAAPQPEMASAFIESLSAPRAVPRPVKPAKLAMPGRHFHIMGDDVPYSVRAWRGQPARDPLVEALFGPAGAEVRA